MSDYGPREQLRNLALAELNMAIIQACIKVQEEHSLSAAEMATVKLRAASGMVELAIRPMRARLPR